MGFREQYIQWQLINYLVTDEQYRVLKINDNQSEIWLEKTEHKQFQLIRLIGYDLDWSNWLKRDIEAVTVLGERFRKQLKKRQVNILNIYVSTYPPVDDYEAEVGKTFSLSSANRVATNTLIFESSNYDEAIASFNNHLNSNFVLQLKDNYEEYDITDLKQRTMASVQKRAKREVDIFQYGKPFFTYIFIAVQVIVFLIMEIAGGSSDISTLLRFGAKFNPLIIEGEWWRFFAPIVIHIGFLHLFMNTLALYYLGTAVERIFGNARFLFIYITAGFGGTLASFVYSDSISAGASGAIFGCFGALLYFGVVYPRLFIRTMGMNVLIVIGINLMLGFSVPMIDNAGHLGGLVGGFLATAIVHFPKKRRIPVQLLSFLVAIGLSVVLLQVGYSADNQAINESSVTILSQSAIENEDYDGAYELLTNYLAEGGNSSVDVLLTLGFVEINLNKYDDAKQHFITVIEQDELPEAHYYLSVLYTEENDFRKAVEHAERAVEIAPDNENFKNLLKSITDYLQGFDERNKDSR